MKLRRRCPNIRDNKNYYSKAPEYNPNANKVQGNSWKGIVGMVGLGGKLEGVPETTLFLGGCRRRWGRTYHRWDLVLGNFAIVPREICWWRGSSLTVGTSSLLISWLQAPTGGLGWVLCLMRLSRPVAVAEWRVAWRKVHAHLANGHLGARARSRTSPVGLEAWPQCDDAPGGAAAVGEHGSVGGTESAMKPRHLWQGDTPTVPRRRVAAARGMSFSSSEWWRHSAGG